MHHTDDCALGIEELGIVLNALLAKKQGCRTAGCRSAKAYISAIIRPAVNMVMLMPVSAAKTARNGTATVEIMMPIATLLIRLVRIRATTIITRKKTG